MPQLPFGFDPDGGTFSNVKLPPPRVNDRYTPSGLTSQTVQPGLNRWQRFDRFISNIGNWFAENFDEAVDKLSVWTAFILIIGAVIAVITVWIKYSFINAVFTAIGAMVVIGIGYYIAEIVLPIMVGIAMFAGRFIFWNAITFLLLICVIVGGLTHSALRPAPSKTETIEVVAEPASRIYTCTASTLNVRSEPSTASAILGVVRRGEQVEVLDTDGGFARINYKGNTGYIATRYIEPVE